MGDHLSDTTGSSVDGDGDIELNPLRHSSFDSTEDDGLGNYNNSVIDKLQRGGDSNGYKIVGYDPVDTELDVSQRSAHIISPSVGGRVQNAATYVVNGSLKARSTSFSARSYEHLKVKSRSSGSGGSEKGVLINSLEAPKFDSDECKEVVFRLESPDGTNMASDVHAGSEEAVVDATLHLLRILESLNGEGSALAADLALLRKVSPFLTIACVTNTCLSSDYVS